MNIESKIERDIKKAKSKLIAKAKESGRYENFGQKEVSELADKYYDYLYETSKKDYNENTKLYDLIINFDIWCMDFDDNDLKTY